MKGKMGKLRGKSFSLRLITLFALVAFLLFAAGSCALGGGNRPGTPHAADGLHADCRSCHEEGLNGAPKTDHAKKADCLSCHPVFIRTTSQAGTQPGQ